MNVELIKKYCEVLEEIDTGIDYGVLYKGADGRVRAGFIVHEDEEIEVFDYFCDTVEMFHELAEGLMS